MAGLRGPPAQRLPFAGYERGRAGLGGLGGGERRPAGGPARGVGEFADVASAGAPQGSR